MLAIYRVSRWLHLRGIPVIPRFLKILNRLLFSVVLPPSASLGRGVLLSYQGLGTVIHRHAVIGDSVIVSTGVTIGGRAGSEKVPVICQGAAIGTGAKIIGDVRIGKYASIGANAVVIHDVPDFGVAVGVPARVVRINDPGAMPDYFEYQHRE